MELNNSRQIRQDFPILSQMINGKPLIYLDSGATTQKPLAVIQAINEYNEKHHANIHRGAYQLSVQATEIYEKVRKKVQYWIKAKEAEEIIFTKSTTESLNLLAYSYGISFIESGDEIVLSITNHHSNILPWQQVAKVKGATLKYLRLNKNGQISKEEIQKVITKRTKIVSLSHVSNVLGTIHPIEEITAYAHKQGAIVIVDGAQSVPHQKIDVQKMDIDFLGFSAHKMLGPAGVGILYGKEELLEKMPPFLTGGDMIEYVEEEQSTFAPVPYKFEAGTQNVEGAVGLGAAIDYLDGIGMEAIERYEHKLVQYALEKMKEIPYIKVYGLENLTERGPVISFNIEGVHPHDVASIVDQDGIALRAGHHCAQPLMKYLDLPATCRISFYVYNSKDDIDRFIESIQGVRRWLGYGS